MPHGDFSDWSGLGLLVGGLQQIFYPAYTFSEIGAFKPYFNGSVETSTPESTARQLEMDRFVVGLFTSLSVILCFVNSSVLALLRICGGFLVVLGCMLYTVRWNTINGKLSGFALILAAANIGYVVYVCMRARVCMHVCMYACMHVCMYACMHVCMYACMHVCMFVCMHVCMYVCKYVYVCVCACMYAFVLVCSCV
jgi:hypothetical protein